MAPSTTKQWTVEGKEGFESLKLNEKAPIPSLGDRDVLVHFYAASLNYRDLIIPKVGYLLARTDGLRLLIQSSAGEVPIPYQRSRRAWIRWRRGRRGCRCSRHTLQGWRQGPDAVQPSASCWTNYLGNRWHWLGRSSGRDTAPVWRLRRPGIDAHARDTGLQASEHFDLRWSDCLEWTLRARV